MARSFDGVNQELVSGVGNSAFTGYPFTVNCWMYTAATNVILWSSNDGASFPNDDGFWVQTRTSTNLRMTARSPADGYDHAQPAPWSNNTWHMITYVGTSATSRAGFIDGGNKATNTASNTPSGIDRFSIASNYGNTYLAGRVANLSIHNVALSDAEVAKLFGAGGVMLPPDIVRPDALDHFWPLRDGDGDIDVVGGLNLTANNSPTYAARPPEIEHKPTLWLPPSVSLKIVTPSTIALGSLAIAPVAEDRQEPTELVLNSSALAPEPIGLQLPSQLNLASSEQAPTLTADTTQTPAAQDLNAALQTPVHGITEITAPRTPIASVQAPTYQADTTQTPATLDVVSSVQAPTVQTSGDATFVATEQILASAEQAPTVTTDATFVAADLLLFVNMLPATQRGRVYKPVSVVNLLEFVQSPLDQIYLPVGVQTVSAAEQAPTVDTGTDPTITPSVLDVVSSVPAPVHSVGPWFMVLFPQTLKTPSYSQPNSNKPSFLISHDATFVDLTSNPIAPTPIDVFTVAEQVVTGAVQPPSFTSPGQISPPVVTLNVNLQQISINRDWSAPPLVVNMGEQAPETVLSYTPDVFGAGGRIVAVALLGFQVHVGDRIHAPGEITLRPFVQSPTVIPDNNVDFAASVVSFTSNVPTPDYKAPLELPAAIDVVSSTQAPAYTIAAQPAAVNFNAAAQTPFLAVGAGSIFVAPTQVIGWEIPQPSVDFWLALPPVVSFSAGVQAPTTETATQTTIAGTATTIRAFAFAPVFYVDVNFVIGIAELDTINQVWVASLTNVNDNLDVWEATVTSAETWQAVLEDNDMTIVSRDFISIPVTLKQTAVANYNLVTGSVVQASLVTPHSREVQVSPVTLVENTHWTAGSNSVTADFPATGTDLSGNVIAKTPVILEIQVTPPNGKVRSFFSSNIPVLFDTID